MEFHLRLAPIFCTVSATTDVVRIAMTDDTSPYEAHRAFAREMNARIQRVYSYAGLLALGAGGSVLGVAWVLGALGTLAPWPLSVLVFLVTLFFVRETIRRRTQTYHQRVLEFCQVNALEAEGFYDYYAQDQTFSFLGTLNSSTALLTHERDPTPPVR